MSHFDERTRERLIQKISRWKTGDGTDCPVLAGKPAKLVRVGIVCRSEGDRRCGAPWDLQPAWDPGTIADMILEAFQELADARRMQTHAVATFYFDGIQGADGRKWAREFELTIDPEQGDSEWMPQTDMRRRENLEATVISGTHAQIVHMSQVLVSSHQASVQMFAGVCDTMARMLNEERINGRTWQTQAMAAMDNAVDREIRKAKAASHTRMVEGVVGSITPGLSVAVAGLLQAGGKYLGIEPEPIDQEMLSILEDVGEDPVKLLKACEVLGLSESKRQKLLLLLQKAVAAKKALAIQETAQVAMAGVTKPMPYARFKVIASGAKNTNGAAAAAGQK